jgi:hypothetical protein
MRITPDAAVEQLHLGANLSRCDPRSDLVKLLARCEGSAIWTETNGRRACAGPLWLGDIRPVPRRPGRDREVPQGESPPSIAPRAVCSLPWTTPC